MNTNPLPLSAYGFIVLALVLLFLTWRTLRGWWHSHGSVATLRKRQLEQAQKDELMYAQAAEYYTGLADGARKTINRLSAPTFTPGAGTQRVVVHTVGGGGGGVGAGDGGPKEPLDTASGEGLDWWGRVAGIGRPPGLSDDAYRTAIRRVME